MHWFYVQHKVFNPANNHSAASIHIGRRDGIPKFALDEDLAGRRERRTDNRHLTDHSLLAGYDFISACLQSDRHKKDSDMPDREATAKAAQRLNAHLRDWAVNKQERAQDHQHDAACPKDAVRLKLGFQYEHCERGDKIRTSAIDRNGSNSSA